MPAGRVERYKKTKELIDSAKAEAAVTNEIVTELENEQQKQYQEGEPAPGIDSSNTDPQLSQHQEDESIINHEPVIDQQLYDTNNNNESVPGAIEDEEQLSEQAAKEARQKLKEKVQTVFDVMRFLRVDFEDFLEEVGVNGDTRRRRQLGQTVYNFDYMAQFRRHKRTSDIWDRVTTSSKKISAMVVGDEITALAENSNAFCSKEQLDKKGEQVQPLELETDDEDYQHQEKDEQEQEQEQDGINEVIPPTVSTSMEEVVDPENPENAGLSEEQINDKKRRRQIKGIEYAKKRVKRFNDSDPFDDIVKFSPHLSYILRAAMYTDETVRAYCDMHDLFKAEKLNFEKRMSVIENNMQLGNEERYLKLITMFMVLCSARHLQSGIRQVQLGKLFQEAGTRRELINLLSKMGIMKSYQTIQNALNHRMKWKEANNNDEELPPPPSS